MGTYMPWTLELDDFPTFLIQLSIGFSLPDLATVLNSDQKQCSDSQWQRIPFRWGFVPCADYFACGTAQSANVNCPPPVQELTVQWLSPCRSGAQVVAVRCSLGRISPLQATVLDPTKQSASLVRTVDPASSKDRRRRATGGIDDPGRCIDWSLASSDDVLP